MSEASPSHDLTGWQKLGLMIYFVLCGFPALEINGFGFGIPISLETALACATVGGALGGALCCSRPIVAGLVGGLIAGPIGLLAVYYYTRHRASVWTLELVFVQLIGSLPGVGIGHLLKRGLAWFAHEGNQTANSTGS